ELQNNLAAAIRENTELNKLATNYRTWCESVSHLQHELVSKETNLSQQIISECHLEGNAPLTLPETIALINQKISVTATSEASKMQTLRDRITSLESQLSNTQTDYQKEKQDRERQQTTLTQKQARITELEASAGNSAALNNQISTQQTTITSQATQLANLQAQGEKSRN
ncbi:19712_t:CDS:2, partial [Racocetra persica]